MSKKILLLPRWMTGIKLYGPAGGFDVRIGELGGNNIITQDVVGFSLGALAVLKNSSRIQGRIILVNPPLPRRNALIWLFIWLRYLASWDLAPGHRWFAWNPSAFMATIWESFWLFREDFSRELEAAKDRMTVIRGKNDAYFCNASAAGFIRSKGVKLIEVEGGHNWSKIIEEAVRGA